MREIVRWAIAPLVLLVLLTSACVADVVKNLSTGIDDATSAQLTNNQADADYSIVAGGTGGHVGETLVARSTPIANGWLTDAASSASRWIVLNTGVGQEGINVGPGTYLFRTTVDLAGFDPQSAVIPSLRYAADNKLVSLRVNGTAVFAQDLTFAEEFGSFRQLPANLGLGLFQAGANTVSFELLNQEGANTPLGLRVEGSVTAQVPEPAAAAVAAVLMAAPSGGFPRRRPRRRPRARRSNPSR